MPNNDSNEVLTVKVRALEREVQQLKNDMRTTMEEVDEIQGSNRLTLHKLDEITVAVGEIRATVNKDSGWRGFFLDFVKAIAQIAVLVGAGKWIF